MLLFPSLPTFIFTSHCTPVPNVMLFCFEVRGYTVVIITGTGSNACYIEHLNSVELRENDDPDGPDEVS